MSDTSMDAPLGIVVGTAGHIDHGKTSLVRALTGMDTDRLAEEKRRGISIDLGFAHLTLPDRRTISFIDVPGHERFIKNMLAGAVGIQAVVMVIAADEGVKPQTREHFEICRLLGIRHGVIALTKIDTVPAERIRTVCDEIHNWCAGSFLGHAQIIPVSAKTGTGLSELEAALSKLLDQLPQRSHGDLARLPIDRSFTLRGFGTVVTGTLWGGKLSTGDVVEVYPAPRAARIRGLQVHGKSVEVALAGQRTAVNLSGIDSAEIRRGCVLTHSGPIETTAVLDVLLEWLDESEIPRTAEDVLLHVGTAEVYSRVKMFEPANQRRQTLARLRLSGRALAFPGDRLVLRRPSPAQTIAGGVVIDAFPRVRASRSKTVARLHALSKADDHARVKLLVEESAIGRRIDELIRLTGLSEKHIRSLIAHNTSLLVIDGADTVVTKEWIAQKRDKLLNWLQAFHSQNPSAAGAPISAARLGLHPEIAAALFHNFPEIRVTGNSVALATHKARLTDNEIQARSKIEDLFRKGGFQPPSLSEALLRAGTDAKQARAMLESLIRSKVLVRISEDLIFHADTLAHIRKSLASQKGRKFSVSDFKESTQISRKYAIPLLEYLDREHVTRREGDVRVVL